MSGDPRRLVNPPGQPSLDYRVGTYSSFLERMLRRLHSQTVPGPEGTRLTPLAGFNMIPEGNWVVALLKAWAMVGDVLTFYQERIANEGYLGTAVEADSVRRLLASIGYTPRPGVAAGTQLALKITAGRDAATAVRVPRGIRVQSLPAPGSAPQTFETGEDLEARAAWNELRPALPTRPVPQTLTGATTAVLLDGRKTGLAKGAPVLVTGNPGGAAETTHLRSLTEVKPEGQADATRVAWKAPLDPAESPQELEQPRIFAFRLRASLFGNDAPDFAKLPDREKRRVLPLRGGVTLSSGGPGPWTPVNQGLPEVPARALVETSGGVWLAGFPKLGVFRSPDPAAGWQPANQGLRKKDVHTLLARPDGTVLAGTSDGGVFRTTDGGESWEEVAGSLLPQPPPGLLRARAPRSTRLLPKTVVRALTATARGGTRVLVAGTDSGIFLHDGVGGGWQPANQGLPGTDPKTGQSSVVVAALAAGGRAGEIYAGTARGVFRSTDRGERWCPVNAGLPATDPKTGLSATGVETLLLVSDERTRIDYLYAGTKAGLFLSTDGGGSWRAVNHGLPGTDPRSGVSRTAVAALTHVADPVTLGSDLYAGTPAGLFRSTDRGETWAAVEGAPASAVSALTAARDGTVGAATEPAGFAADEWPGFFLHGDQIDLSRTFPNLVAGGWIALEQSPAGGGPHIGVYPVAAVETVFREDFGLSGQVTRIVVDRDRALDAPDLRGFDLRETVVHAASEELPFFVARVPERTPLPASVGEAAVLRLLASPAEPLPVGRKVILQGRPIRVGLRDGAPPWKATVGSPPVVFSLPAEASFPVMVPARRQGKRTVLEILGPGGRPVTVTAGSEDLLWLPAEAGDPTFALPGTVESHAQDGGRAAGSSRLVVSLPPIGAFDPETVRIWGNVVEATQGTTVPDEVLGSGDAGVGYQRFPVARPPLTHVRAPTAEGFRSTLEVRVEGIRWEPVTSLETATASDQVYAVRHLDGGGAEVVFGNGVRGARLPSGRENVRASYRTGMWPESLPADRLTVLQTSPPGVEGVAGPLPTGGGAAPESLAAARRHAPRWIRALDRVVSFDDYEDFVLTYPGVAKAHVQPLTTPAGSSLLAITVAAEATRTEPSDTAPSDPDQGSDALIGELTRSLEQARNPHLPFQVLRYEPAPFVLAATLEVDRRYQPRRVEEAVEEVLTTAYGFETAAFEASVSAAEVLTLVRRVAGVVTVGLDAFHEAVSGEGVATTLSAAPARWSTAPPRRVLPARLLLLSTAAGGLRITTRRAS